MVWRGGAGRLLAAAVCLWTWELGSHQAARPPLLEPAANQTVLQPGETLTVRCRGTRPVTWSTTSLATDFSSRVTITNETTSDAGYPYVSTLEIRDVGHLDVGYQSCQLAGTPSQDPAQSAARVYLFVNDTEHLLVLSQKDMFITLKPNVPGVIPCRPSHPDVRVTLNRNGREVWPEGDETISFDNRRGFVLQDVQPLAAGFYTCASRRRPHESKLVHVYVIPATESVPKPQIDKSETRNAVVGYNFSLVCRVHVEPAVRLALEWRVPATSTGLQTGRIRQEAETTQNSAVTRRLVVTDARREDEGSYSCTGRDHNGLTNSRTEYIRIYDADQASVELIAAKTEFDMRLGTSVKIVVNVKAYPRPDVVWYNPGGGEIHNTAKHAVSTPFDQTILEISHLQLRDMGEYTVVATSPNGKANDSLAVRIIVRDQPRVHLDDPREYYMAGRRYTLSCDVTGFPTPRVMWRFVPCMNEPCDAPDTELNLTRPNEEEEVSLSSKPYHVQSNLTVTAIRSGAYKCLARNSQHPDGEAEAWQRFFVTDIADGFDLVRPGVPVVDGDSVNMTCAGSSLTFRSLDDLVWHRSAGGDQRLDPVTSLPGVSLVEETTKYSYRKVLVFDPARLQHSGLYHCSGLDITGIKNRKQEWFGVIPALLPAFTNSANMDASASLQLEVGSPAELNCTVTGRPPPVVTWTKDGRPLKLDNSERVRLSSDGQRLIIGAVLNDDAGNYECRAENRKGALLGSAELVVPDDTTIMHVVGAITGVLVLCLIAVAACLAWKCKQQKTLQRQLLSQAELNDFKRGKMSQFNPSFPIDEQAALLPYDSEWEFPKERLFLGRQIGSGAFGRVLRAEAIGLTPRQTRTVVAVKMPKSGSDPDQIRSMMSELKIMIQLGKHLNVVNLLGAVTVHAEHGEFMVLVEYCRHGNLHDYLHRHKNGFINQVHPISGEYDPSLGAEEFRAAMRQHQTTENTPLNYAMLDHASSAGGRLRLMSGGSYYQTPRRGSATSSVGSVSCSTGGTVTESVCESPSAAVDSTNRFTTSATARQQRSPLTTRDLLRWSYQVARGMEYLASRKLLHGDLAARNILLAEDSIVKISDFGLSRDIYKTRDYKKKSGKGLLPVKWMAIESLQDNIFSTQSDVWSFGIVMWEFFSLGASPYPGMEYDVNFVRRLRDGYRMELPKFSPKEAYRLMLHCWHERPGERPNFTEISERLGLCLEDHVTMEYMKLNEPYKLMNEEYFARRTDYVNVIVSPDYQNVTAQDLTSDDSSDDASGQVTVCPRLQAVGYMSPDKGGRVPSRLTDTDSYLLMTPAPDQALRSTSIFSPWPADAERPNSHFEFPPAPQLAPAPDSPPPAFSNPSYQGTGRVPSTHETDTRAPPALAAVGQGQEHYRHPVPVGCEQLV
ncbi:vascular endothelial growth factor receptor 1-like isoform X2 [Pollicipes pollicipes]|uniref:vascular endothelial growth factor receptor 1-like isoform X2 n=1 Tax=Pollicipes pollicipes TaxID=41117 RepID=UPI0018855AB6|nr:vascular endothelial growth factor receptor 1-like isoform X2 [Pollicipes pollicipes]